MANSKQKLGRWGEEQVGQGGDESAIYYLPADLQVPSMFVPRQPLSVTARRAGWQGFIYDLSQMAPGSLVRLK